MTVANVEIVKVLDGSQLKLAKGVIIAGEANDIQEDIIAVDARGNAKRFLAMVKLIRSFLGGVVFYTTIPLPSGWQLEFTRVARWAPLIGVSLGGLLGLIDIVLNWLGVPILTRSGLLIALGIAFTGGLHLDGVIDTADGLGVNQPERRLAVMKDSVTGAFGVMAAATVIMLKLAALGEINLYRWLGLMLAGGWGRWGQVMAIALYPYLRATGKGALHQKNLRCPQDVLLGLLVMLGCSGIFSYLEPQRWWLGIAIAVASSAIALFTGYWFERQFQGHTGDTYGAVVEWTEALILCGLTVFWH